MLSRTDVADPIIWTIPFRYDLVKRIRDGYGCHNGIAMSAKPSGICFLK